MVVKVSQIQLHRREVRISVLANSVDAGGHACSRFVGNACHSPISHHKSTCAEAMHFLSHQRPHQLLWNKLLAAEFCAARLAPRQSRSKHVVTKLTVRNHQDLLIGGIHSLGKSKQISLQVAHMAKDCLRIPWCRRAEVIALLHLIRTHERLHNLLELLRIDEELSTIPFRKRSNRFRHALLLELEGRSCPRRSERAQCAFDDNLWERSVLP
mmetsp:Transcript_61275/g.145888  ORF Transcript_61275/g.145888 Transcript_61275/m.145888 type:complete len:212 (+) Transcript_61275:508-1143(+)